MTTNTDAVSKETCCHKEINNKKNAKENQKRMQSFANDPGSILDLWFY